MGAAYLPLLGHHQPNRHLAWGDDHSPPASASPELFRQRPVGEVSSRISELEKIRRFLTGTALTVLLDAVFSVIYIGVMLLYSVQLTFWALAVLPLFVALTIGVAPVIRQQLRQQAEANARVRAIWWTLSGMEL